MNQRYRNTIFLAVIAVFLSSCAWSDRPGSNTVTGSTVAPVTSTPKPASTSPALKWQLPDIATTTFGIENKSGCLLEPGTTCFSVNFVPFPDKQKETNPHLLQALYWTSVHYSAKPVKSLYQFCPSTFSP